MAIEVEYNVAYLPWFDNQSDPRENLQRRAEEPIECSICYTELEWNDTKNAHCPSCRRRVPAGTGKFRHLFAKNYTIYVRK